MSSKRLTYDVCLCSAPLLSPVLHSIMSKLATCQYFTRDKYVSLASFTGNSFFQMMWLANFQLADLQLAVSHLAHYPDTQSTCPYSDTTLFSACPYSDTTLFSAWCLWVTYKTLYEKSRECNNQKPTPTTHDTRQYFYWTGHWCFNPYKPGVLFLGHRQTVQTLIRRSDTPKIGNGFVQLIRMDQSTRQMWVKMTLA